MVGCAGAKGWRWGQIAIATAGLAAAPTGSLRAAAQRSLEEGLAAD